MKSIFYKVYNALKGSFAVNNTEIKNNYEKNINHIDSITTVCYYIEVVSDTEYQCY